MLPMNRRDAIICYVLLICGVVGTLAVHASDSQSGDWTIRRSDEPGKVEFSLMTRNQHGSSHHESDWPLSAFQGLDVSKPGKQDVKFTISRDAGRFECEGFLDNGEGAGIFHFFPDAKYAQEMRSLGFSGVYGDRQFVMAIMDVSYAFAKQINFFFNDAATTEKLIAFRIHGVTPEFIEKLRAAGLTISDSEKLVAFRIHGVSPEFVQQLRAAGMNVTDNEKLVAFRIHGVSPEMVR